MITREPEIVVELPNIAIELEIWSSDKERFILNSKHISTTLKNTVFDIKEEVCCRNSAAVNVKALIFIYKNREHRDHEELGQFLIQEQDPIRIRFEINHNGTEPINGTFHSRQSLMNINLKYSDGQKFTFREPLETTIRSLKETIVDNRKLNGLHDITTLETKLGQEVQDQDDLTIGELLKLDVAPPYDLNFYVRTKDDFLIRLSSPSQEVLRLNKVIVSLETTIITIKQFMIDQYTGNHNIDVSQIKLIYSGRVLGNEQKLKEIITEESTSVSLITFHFVINDPEPVQQSSGGFWSDLRNGNSLFEFLPLEPNPNFEADLERDRLLRERLSGSAEADGATDTNPAPVSQPIAQPVPQPPVGNAPPMYQTPSPTNVSQNENYEEFPNRPPQNVGYELIGDSYDNVSNKKGEECVVDQMDLAETYYEITINSTDGPKSIKLSSSNTIINDIDPQTPYLMLSPSAFAKLRKLGVDIQPPKVLRETNEPEYRPLSPLQFIPQASHAVPNIASSTTVPLTTPQPRNQAIPQMPQQQQQQQQQQARRPGPFPRVRREGSNIIVNIRRFSGQLNSANFTRPLRILGKLLYHLVKITLFYNLIVEPIRDNFHRNFAISLLGLYLYTNQTIRSLLQEIHLLLPTSTRDWITRYIISPEAWIASRVTGLRFGFIDSILNMLPPNESDHSWTNVADRVIRTITVAIVLFFTSSEPTLHRSFHEIWHLRTMRANQAVERASREAQEAQQNETQQAQHQEGVQDEPEVEPEAPAGHVLGTIDNNLEERIGNQDNATGVQVHHEN